MIKFKDRYTIEGVSACRLAYAYFFGNRTHTLEDYVNRRVQEPYAVQLLGEYDIWNHSNPDTVPFQYGINSLKTVEWDNVLSSSLFPPPDGQLWGGTEADVYIEEVIDKGRAIETYVTQMNAEISTKRGFDVRFEGLLFRALCTARSNSLTFSAAIRPEHDGCLSYFWDGARWKFSLYGVEHKRDIDLSLIAKRYGGGGHKQACGGTFAELPRELGGKAC